MSKGKNESKDWLYIFYLSLFGVFFARVWSLALFLDEIGLRSGWIASWADGAAHLTYMSAFAYRSKFPTSHPIFLGKEFSYPYIADMIGGYMVKLGLPLHTTYNLLGWVFSMFMVVMVWRLFRKIYKRSQIALLSSLVFFFGAGLTNIGKFLGNNWGNIFDTYDWVDIISAQIMPQRALILGFPIGIWIFLTINDYFNKKDISKNKLLVAGVLTGLMSKIHTHTLIGLFFVVSWLFAVDVWKKRKIQSGWWWYGLSSVILGILLLSKQTSSFDANFFHFSPFWLAKIKGDNVFWFWLKSWGIWPILAFLGYRKATKNQRVIAPVLLILFLLLNVFSFQPYEWDNTKLFLWIYLFFSGYVGLWLFKMRKKKMLFWLCFLMLTFSGAIDASKLLTPQNDPVLYLGSHQDIRMANEIIEKTDDESVFVTNNYHLNIIPTLTGRQILLGYPGWLWTYGIDYRQREIDVQSIYVGGENSVGLMNRYGVDYVVFDGIVNGSYAGANEEYFSNNYEKVFENGAYRIYKI